MRHMKKHLARGFAMTLVAVGMFGAPALAAKPQPVVALSTDVEDGLKYIIATVTLNGEPIEDVDVVFKVVRTFGELALGSDTTLDDGTAAAEFPEGLPGDEEGRIKVVASVAGTDEYGASEVSALFGGAPSIAMVNQPIPHALWSAKPLWPLVIVIVSLGGIVWITFGVVCVFLLQIHYDRKEALT